MLRARLARVLGFDVAFADAALAALAEAAGSVAPPGEAGPRLGRTFVLLNLIDTRGSLQLRGKNRKICFFKTYCICFEDMIFQNILHLFDGWPKFLPKERSQKNQHKTHLLSKLFGASMSPHELLGMARNGGSFGMMRLMAFAASLDHRHRNQLDALGPIWDA
jgi:hypothetical protein